MTNITIEEQIMDLFVNQGYSPTVDVDENLFTTYDLDDLDMIEFVMKVEEEFGVEINDSELDSIQTLSDLVVIVETKVYGGEVE